MLQSTLANQMFCLVIPVVTKACTGICTEANWCSIQHLLKLKWTYPIEEPILNWHEPPSPRCTLLILRIVTRLFKVETNMTIENLVGISLWQSCIKCTPPPPINNQLTTTFCRIALDGHPESQSSRHWTQHRNVWFLLHSKYMHLSTMGCLLATVRYVLSSLGRVLCQCLSIWKASQPHAPKLFRPQNKETRKGKGWKSEYYRTKKVNPSTEAEALEDLPMPKEKDQNQQKISVCAFGGFLCICLFSSSHTSSLVSSTFLDGCCPWLPDKNRVSFVQYYGPAKLMLFNGFCGLNAHCKFWEKVEIDT